MKDNWTLVPEIDVEVSRDSRGCVHVRNSRSDKEYKIESDNTFRKRIKGKYETFSSLRLWDHATHAKPYEKVMSFASETPRGDREQLDEKVMDIVYDLVYSLSTQDIRSCPAHTRLMVLNSLISKLGLLNKPKAPSQDELEDIELKKIYAELYSKNKKPVLVD